MRRIVIGTLHLKALMLLAAAALVAVALMMVGTKPAQAATFTVTNTNDSGAGSLRQSITDANDETTNPGNDVIEFAAAIQGTIDLASELPSLSNIEIKGPGADKLTVRRSLASGTPDFIVFATGQSVSISGLTISNGKVGNGLCGGGIWNVGTLNVTNSTISGNSTGGSGGGICNLGTVNVTNSTISGNSASTFSQQPRGGGIYNVGALNVTNSTISGNNASGSPAASGGGIYNNSGGTVNVANSTITGNSAFNGGGIFIISGGGVDVRSSIVAGNTGSDVVGSMSSGGFNLIGGDPKLGPLQNNGGPTKTHAPLDGSPALDKGNSFDNSTDQRGIARPQDNPSIDNATGGDGSDIGAVEVLGISIGTSKVTESNAGSVNTLFTVRLLGASSVPVMVGYATEDDTATSSEDYQAASGTLTFLPGETSKTITVPVIGDTLDEFTENFLVKLSNVPNPQGIVFFQDGPGIGTIFDNDPAPSLSVNEAAAVTEGSSGTTNARFTVSLSAASGKAVSVDYATDDNTATLAGGDYSETSGTLYFSPGTTTRTVTVPVNGDTLDEPDETFLLKLSNASNAPISDGQGIVTINDDDAEPTLSVGDTTVPEGDSDTTDATFTVSLSVASGKQVSVDYATSDGTATAGSDYQASSGSLTFAPGETTKTVTVLVNSDTADEPDETFSMDLSNASNATISDGTGTGTIDEDDDRAPEVVESSLIPPKGKTGVRRNTNVTAKFSEVMDEATLTTSTVKLFKVNSDGSTTQVTNSPVSCVDDPCQTVTLDPFGTSTTLLGRNTNYRVVITTGVADAAGNALASEYSWTFKTGRR